MKLYDFDYHLPKNLIAQQPLKPRDRSRLLVFSKKTKQITDKYFYDIVDYLNKGDVLVLNNSKVFPARLIGKKIPTRGKIEVFLLKKENPLSPSSSGGKARGEIWQCLIGGKGRKEKLEIKFDKVLKAVILKNNNDGTWLVQFNKSGEIFMKMVEEIGRVPLPPYIKRDSIASPASPAGGLQNDKEKYQTVYAKKLGSVAAPTAGLHFTPALLNKIKAKGVQIEFVTLHVGLGTFAPVKVDDIKKHKMHEEYVEVSADTIKRIVCAKSEGKRIIAVGTTSVRTLESVFDYCHSEAVGRRIYNISQTHLPSIKDPSFRSTPLRMTKSKGWINLFIYPGYKFKMVDAMITNFHLPKSTLLMLISAFIGRKNVLKVYRQAIRKKYRFYSYGDAMFIY